MHKRKIILFILLFFTTSPVCLSQQIHYYSDNFYGGVTGGGFNPGYSPVNSSISLNIPNNSTIRKAFLFATSKKYVEEVNFLDSIAITINGNSLWIGNQHSINNNYIYERGFAPSDYIELKTLVKDITYLSSTLNQSPLIVESILQMELPAIMHYYILILYENNSPTKTSVDIFINNLNYHPALNYSLVASSIIDYSENVGLIINTENICDTLSDGSYISVNSNSIGLIGGSEFNTINVACSSPSGNFYYENNTLYGLTDDIPDSLMNGTDAIANIKNYGANTPIDVNFNHQSPGQTISKSNIVDQLFLTYTSPCDTFTSSVTPDTTICLGEQLQLQATGGVSTSTSTGYEWSAISNPSAINDLSCTDCPNPVFSGDSSQTYTVRIWNTDSCSVVKPVKINVSQPQPINAKMYRSTCSFSTGKILVENLPGKAVQLGAVNTLGDTISPTSGNNFTGLSAGEYTVFYIDKYGCSVDTLIYVEPVISTIAQFNTYPKTGTAPIQINLTNQSQNATDYSWWLNGDYQGNQFSGFWTDTSGTYVIELIAWKTDTICADTVSFTVFIFDSLVASLPNVFTPNNDGVNDFFNVKVNLPVAYDLVILNRWGNVVFENEGDLIKGEHKLWNGEIKNGEKVTDGTYFYKMVFGLEDAQQCNCSTGFDCELTDCEVVKQGFVQVRR